MTADSTPDWGFDTANMLSVKVLVALRYKIAGLHLISVEGINEGGTHIITIQFFTGLLCMINSLEEHTKQPNLK